MNTRKSISGSVLVASAAWLAGACTDDAPSVASQSGALTVQCAAPMDVPDGGWLCPEAREVRCADLDDTTLFVSSGDAGMDCSPAVALAEDGPYVPGTTRTVRVVDGDAGVCEAELTIVDDTPPSVQTHTVSLWPPNHKLHAIDIDQCVTVTDDCDDTLTAEYIYATSDEPVDDIGDGHHAPDIVLDDCGRVSLRAERQGPKDGRVYTLGVRVSDRAGNVTEAECQVRVDHDRGGSVAGDSSEAYRVDFAEQGCDGLPDDADAGM